MTKTILTTFLITISPYEMGLFSSSSSSTPAPEQTIPTRSARQECWNSRDSYYACLTSNSIIIPPGTDMADGRAPGGGLKQTAEDKQKEKEKQQKLLQDRQSDPCKKERDLYEGHCAKSWVSKIKKR